MTPAEKAELARLAKAEQRTLPKAPTRALPARIEPPEIEAILIDDEDTMLVTVQPCQGPLTKLPATLDDATRQYRAHLIVEGQSAARRGQLLLHVRDSKLYRARYETFEAYCRAELDVSRQRAYQLIAGVNPQEAMPPGKSGSHPQSSANNGKRTTQPRPKCPHCGQPMKAERPGSSTPETGVRGDSES